MAACVSPSPTAVPGVVLRGPMHAGYDAILTPEALAFLVELERRFDPERQRLLQVRAQRQDLLDRGEPLGFLPETALIREKAWSVAALPADLQDRRVEITGPADRKTIINGLNSGARVFMADLEDALCPTWDNVVEGQIHLKNAVNRTLFHEDPETGKFYRIGPQAAVLMVRPRGWHLEEKHLLVEGQPMSASLFDFGLFFFHNVKHLMEMGTAPYFYLPKLESHFEARLWNEVFVVAQQALGIPLGTIRATVLIETLPAAFEMEEIVYELRDHCAGLNGGRWDYIFSVIRAFQRHPQWVLPDRDRITMESPFLAAYSRRLVQVCHRRGALAIGGMAAYIPVKDDPVANAAALAQVQADKEREAAAGYDGTWVAHPALAPVAEAVFAAALGERSNQQDHAGGAPVQEAELLIIPDGACTVAGLHHAVAVGIGYLEAWLRGVGCVPLFQRMEDTATAEICRAQVWQWLHHGVTLDDGQGVTRNRVEAVIAEELGAWKRRIGEATFEAGPFAEAAELFRRLVFAPGFVNFLTVPAYAQVSGL